MKAVTDHVCMGIGLIIIIFQILIFQVSNVFCNAKITFIFRITSMNQVYDE